MKSNIYIDILNKKIKMFTEQFENFDDEAHGHMKGVYSESIFRSLLNDFLPSNIEISHGWRIDENGTESGERDILLYDKNSLPPFLFSAGTGLVPLASIKYDIEVKSTLSAEKIHKIINDEIFDKRCQNNALVAVKGKNIFEHYTDNGKKTNEIPIIKLLCSAEDCCYYWFTEYINVLDRYKNFIVERQSYIANNHYKSSQIFQDLLNIDSMQIPPKNQYIRVCRWIKHEHNSLKMFFIHVLHDLYKYNQLIIDYLADKKEQKYTVISKTIFDSDNKVLDHYYNKDGIPEEIDKSLLNFELKMMKGKLIITIKK